ncbi:MAG TPA: hypothetical protein VFM00_09540 [Candidatus Eisenbacteria bacterium]|nr:hypothetical protein [Candidatus Eisenbacteria bacterium]
MKRLAILFALAVALGAAVMGADPGPADAAARGRARAAAAKGQAHDSATAKGSLSQLLAPAYERTARTWPKVGGGFEGRRIVTYLERRDTRKMDLAAARFVPRADSLAARHREASFDPRDAIYSTFRVGADTLRFTWGHMAEEFGGVPRVILAGPGAAPRAFLLAPLAHWNVDALWVVDEYIVFGCASESEGGGIAEQIVVWNLATGRWFGTPSESALAHRGFKLRDFFPAWRTAQAAVVQGSVVLQGSDRALALDPKAGSWSLVSIAGLAIGPNVHQIARRLIPVTEAMRSRLLPQLLGAFQERNREVDSVQVLEVMQDPCAAQRGRAAVLAMGLAPSKATAAQSTDIATTLNRQLFGIFLADSTASTVMAKIDMFPTVAYLDYVVYFDLEAADDAIVIWGQGARYGGDEAQRGYRCGN